MPHTATLPLLLKQLRLSSFTQHWETMLEQASQRQWNAAQYLTALCEQELADRHSRRIHRYTKESQLPPGKTLASFDFIQVSELKVEQIEVFAVLENLQTGLIVRKDKSKKLPGKILNYFRF